MGRFANLATALNGSDPVKAMEAVRDQTGPKTFKKDEGEGPQPESGHAKICSA